MLRRVTHHTRHNVVAYLALFFALTGTAIAAAPLMTGGKIQDGTLNSDDLRDRGSAAYPGPSVQGKDVEADTLTGDEILETSLGKVGDADTVDGYDSTRLLKGVGNEYSGTVTVAPIGRNFAYAECPEGRTVVGGGHHLVSGPVRDYRVERDEYSGSGNGWIVSVVNQGTEEKPIEFYASVRCAY